MKSWFEKSEIGTRIAFTARYGASLRRKATTIGAFHLLSSSGVGDVGAYGVCEAGVYRSRSRAAALYRSGETGTSTISRRGGGVVGAVEARVASVGIEPPFSAAEKAAALGKRSFGSFSRHIMTARARSCGRSGQRSSTGTGFSDKCFTSIDGVLLATNGGWPHSIW